MGQDHDAYVDEEVAGLNEDGGLDSPTDFDEYEMNADDCAPEHDGQPDEAQEWHDFDPDC
jgi:hypothetical protein